MAYHEEIISTALLGTQKKTLQTDILPQTLSEILKQIPFEDEEAKFFQAVALLEQYQKAGKLEVLTNLEEYPYAQPETQEYIDARQQKALEILLSKNQHYSFLWDYFFDKCINSNKIIPPDTLTEFLDYMSSKSAHSEQVIRVIGERGRWLLKLDAVWSQYEKVANSQQDMWNPKNITAKYLLQLRQEAPDKAREYILQYWEEFNTSQRNSFISIFKTNISLDDEPALKRILQWLSSKKIDNNQYLIALQKEATSALLLIPESDLNREVWSKFKNYIVVEKNKVQIKLPEKPDDFFNQEQMLLKLQLLDRSYNELWYNDIESWAYELLRYIPPKRLEEHLNLDKAEILKQFNNNETLVRTVKKQTLALYVRAIADAIWNFRDADWARTWINYFKNVYKLEQEQYASNLCYLLDWQEIEELYQEYISFIYYAADWLEVLINYPKPHQCSEQFSVFVLNQLLLTLANNSLNTSEVQKIFFFLHQDAFLKANDVHPDANAASWLKSNYSSQYRELATLNEIMGLLR